MIARANIATSSTISLLKKTKIVPWEKVVQIFDALVISILTFTCQVWSLGYLDMIEKVQSQFFKKLLCLPKFSSNYAIRLELNRPNLAVIVFNQVLGWLRKIINMGDERYPKICFKNLCNLASKSSCNTKFNWVSQVKKNFLNLSANYICGIGFPV